MPKSPLQLFLHFPHRIDIETCTRKKTGVFRVNDKVDQISRSWGLQVIPEKLRIYSVSDSIPASEKNCKSEMKSYVFSNTKRPLHFIFWGFGVLTSTTKLQSISSIGPLVMEIHHL